MLVDDHPIVRDGLREVVERSGDFGVVQQAGDGVEAVGRAERIGPSALASGTSRERYLLSRRYRGVLSQYARYLSPNTERR